MARERLMDPGSGSLELPRDGSPPPTPPADAAPLDLGLPPERLPDVIPAAIHHVVVAPADRELLDDPRAGQSPTLVRDPVDLEAPHVVENLGQSPTLVRDPVDLEPPARSPTAWRAWIPFALAVLVIFLLVYTCT